MPASHLTQSRFKLGRLVSTPAAIRALQRAGQDPLIFIKRHRSGDWGEVCYSDARANDQATDHEADPDRQERVLSAYVTDTGKRLWIITEADRSSTCIFLPEEY